MNSIRRCAIAVALLACACSARADCVIGAKSKTTVQIIGSHTMLLTGGYGNAIIVRVFNFMQPRSPVLVLKDTFCDFDPSAIAVDGSNANIRQVINAD